MSEEPPQGPNRETLKSLKGMIPSFIRGLAQKRAVGKGKAVLVMRDSKVCTICGAAHTRISLPASPEFIPEGEPCPRCQALLDQGCCAVCCGNEFAIFKPPPGLLQDWVGKVNEIGPQVMAAIKNKFNPMRGNAGTSKSSPNDPSHN